jgi:hypothetical protein
MNYFNGLSSFPSLSANVSAFFPLRTQDVASFALLSQRDTDDCVPPEQRREFRR